MNKWGAGPYLRQGEEGDRPRPQKISTKFGPTIFFKGLLGPKKSYLVLVSSLMLKIAFLTYKTSY